MSRAAKKPKPPPVEVTVPAHIEAERHVLGQAMLDPSLWSQVYAALQVSDFYDKTHRAIYQVARELHEAGQPVDLVTLLGHPGLERCRYYLSELGDEIPAGNPRRWIQLILEKSQLRQVWGLTQKISDLINNHSNLTQCLDYFDKQIRTIRSRSAWPIEGVDDAWREELTWSYVDAKGGRKLARERLNYLRVLANDPRLRGAAVYDEFRQDVVCLAPPPWNHSDLGEMSGRTKVGKPWLDEDYTRLSLWLESEYGSSPGRDTLAELVYTTAKRDAHHPIREILDGLQWDGTPRLEKWLTTYLGAKAIQSNDYLEFVGAKWLISAVARVYWPGCQAHHVLVLEGHQGLGKSTALRTLATLGGQEWFSDTPIQLAQPKDAYATLQGLWIVELAELDTLIRVEDATAKAFFTSASDRYRPPYMRVVRDFPRQCVFAGSVNGDDYLKDATGGRRYWPVACSQIDHPGLARDRDQLWAEAVSRYKAGERWWPETPQEKELCAIEQAERRREDPWTSAIAEWLATQISEDHTAAEILGGAIGLPLERIGTREEMRLSNIMSLFPDWKRTRGQRGKARPRVYRRLTTP